MQEFTKQFYKIKEVAEILDVPQSTIRFWEKEFPTYIKPVRNPHNLRSYRPHDIERLQVIKYLLKDKGLKLDAARDYLRSNPKNIDRTTEVINALTDVRNELAGMLRAIGGRKL